MVNIRFMKFCLERGSSSGRRARLWDLVLRLWPVDLIGGRRPCNTWYWLPLLVCTSSYRYSMNVYLSNEHQIPKTSNIKWLNYTIILYSSFARWRYETIEVEQKQRPCQMCVCVAQPGNEIRDITILLCYNIVMSYHQVWYVGYFVEQLLPITDTITSQWWLRCVSMWFNVM